MKQRIIASLVGAVLIFVWQFLSWGLLGLHDGAFKYHPRQDEILNMLSSGNTEEGIYYLPTVPPGSSYEDEQNLMKANEGKPVVSITYVKSMGFNMGMTMIRQFLTDFFLVFLLIYLLTRGGIPTFIRWIAGAVSVGFFTWLWIPYTSRIWFQVPWEGLWGHLADAIIPWALCGIWLGWYYNRRRTEVRTS